MSNQKKVVIVGGGGAVGSKPFPNLGPFAMLASSRGSLEDKVLIPYDRLFVNGNGAFVQDTVTSITRNADGQGGRIVLSTEKEMEYDVLVLASGRRWEGGLDIPPGRQDAESMVQEWRRKIEPSSGVVIVGGGAVSTELAGEIRDVFPDKDITIVHKESHLLQSIYADKFCVDVEKQWTNRRIRLILDDAIDVIPEYPASQVVTQKGIRVLGNLVIPTRGGPPNTEFIASLQLTGYPGIFAAGDITDCKEVKQVANYGHSKTIVANIVSFLDGKRLQAQYKPMFEFIFLTNGAGGGAAYIDILWGMCFGDWVTRTLKSDDLFITKTRQDMGFS